MTDKDTRLGTGYGLPDELGMVRGVHRQPRLAGGAVVTENGTLASDDFSTGVSGWSIDGSGDVEFNSGTFRGTVAAGSVVTGGITVQSGGSMSSANYVADTSGWKVDGTGTAEFNSVKVRGSITSGGALASSNYSAGSAGWQIAGSGAAEFQSVVIRGTVTSGGTLASPNYSAGSAGWSISGAGSAEFNDVTVRGNIHASSLITTATGSGAYIQVAGGFGDTIIFTDGSTSGLIWQRSSTMNLSSNAAMALSASTDIHLVPGSGSKVKVDGDCLFDGAGGHKVTGVIFHDEPEIDGSGSGLLVHSVNGSRWRIAVTNAGAVTVASA